MATDKYEFDKQNERDKQFVNQVYQEKKAVADQVEGLIDQKKALSDRRGGPNSWRNYFLRSAYSEKQAAADKAKYLGKNGEIANGNGDLYHNKTSFERSWLPYNMFKPWQKSPLDKSRDKLHKTMNDRYGSTSVKTNFFGGLGRIALALPAMLFPPLGIYLLVTGLRDVITAGPKLAYKGIRTAINGKPNFAFQDPKHPKLAGALTAYNGRENKGVANKKVTAGTVVGVTPQASSSRSSSSPPSSSRSSSSPPSRSRSSSMDSSRSRSSSSPRRRASDDMEIGRRRSSSSSSGSSRHFAPVGGSSASSRTPISPTSRHVRSRSEAATHQRSQDMTDRDGAGVTTKKFSTPTGGGATDERAKISASTAARTGRNATETPKNEESTYKKQMNDATPRGTDLNAAIQRQGPDRKPSQIDSADKAKRQGAVPPPPNSGPK